MAGGGWAGHGCKTARLAKMDVAIYLFEAK